MIAAATQITARMALVLRVALRLVFMRRAFCNRHAALAQTPIPFGDPTAFHFSSRPLPCGGQGSF
jgi:hypothetical protein